MSYALLKADARHIPLPDGVVHAVCTSPPYFNLRNYDHPNQIGNEPTIDGFIDAMRTVARELWRVMRPDASWWLNLGDSFSSSPSNQSMTGKRNIGQRHGKLAGTHKSCLALAEVGRQDRSGWGIAPKNLCMIPERVALALQSDGWYVRSKPNWIKPSPMPESTDDRPNVAHESIFLLTKQPTYFFDMSAVRVPSAATTLERDTYSRITSGKDGAYAVQHDHETPSDPSGRHLRTNDFFTASLDALIDHHEGYAAHLRHVRDNGGLVMGEGGDPLAFWVAATSFAGSHFAVWPERLVRIMIKASTSEHGCCGNCGGFWTRIVEADRYEPEVVTVGERRVDSSRADKTRKINGKSQDFREAQASRKTVGWQPSCSCNADVARCLVLDPFAGACTTGMVAESLGRDFVGLDLNADYLSMGRDRIVSSLRPRSKLDPKPVRPSVGQLDLF